MRDAEARADRRGFALVEVLAALVVTAALVAVVLPFATGLVERWWNGQNRLEQADAFMQAVARLGDDIAQAVPLVAPGDPARARVFRCEPKRLDLVRPALGAAAGGRLDLVSYRIVSGAGGDRLLRGERAFRPEDGLPSAATEGATALLEAPLRLRFAASGPSGRTEDVWQGRKDMPARVELAARAAGNEAVAPPSVLLFPLGASGE